MLTGYYQKIMSNCLSQVTPEKKIWKFYFID